MLNKKTERSIQVIEALSAINVMLTIIITENNIELSRKNHAVSFSKDQRAAFLTQFPDAESYADLAGLVDPEPIAQAEQSVA